MDYVLQALQVRYGKSHFIEEPQTLLQTDPIDQGHGEIEH